ncbi:sporulation protein, partial [Priestia megaterium]|uniref:sporulation protein n=1 Tax=Priestia megaterium TaxID=1404 RepID=UPI001649AF9B
FTFHLPDHTPVTLPTTPLSVPTTLHIKHPLHPSHIHHLKLLPNLILTTTIQPIQQLAFPFPQLHSQEPPPTITKTLPFLQQFQFLPTPPVYPHKLHQIQIILQPTPLHHYHLFI